MTFPGLEPYIIKSDEWNQAEDRYLAWQRTHVESGCRAYPHAFCYLKYLHQRDIESIDGEFTVVEGKLLGDGR